MANILTEKQVAAYMNAMSNEQKSFIESHIKQSKKSKWLEVLANKKGISFDYEAPIDELESEIDDWVLEEILDSGYGKRNYRCECNMPLRFQ